MENVTARIEFECGYTEERTMLAKHRRMYLKAGRTIICPVHKVSELMIAVEEIRVPEGWEAFKERMPTAG